MKSVKQAPKLNMWKAKGILGDTLETDMLIDYGASTSVMARSIIDELEKRTGAYIPRINTHMLYFFSFFMI